MDYKTEVTQELENYFAIFLVIKLNCRDKWEVDEEGGRKEQSPVLFSSEGDRGLDRVRAQMARQSFVPYSTVPLYLTNLYMLYSVKPSAKH